MSSPLTLLAVHPHPDDESIACGGVLAKAVASGHRAVVVTCTGGEEGDNLAGIDLGDEDMATHRRRELADALRALGVERHHWLGYRDSGMVGTPGNDHPQSFHAAGLDEAAARLASIIRAERPHVVVSDDANGTYGHPDHVKAHRVTVRAVELAANAAASIDGAPWQVVKRYVHTMGRRRLFETHQALLAVGRASPFGEDPIAAPADLPFGADDEKVTTEVDVVAWLERKRAALTAHRSQIGTDSFFLNTPDEMAAAFFGTEQFVLEAGRVAGGGVERDLFDGVGPQDRPGVGPGGRPGPGVGVGRPTDEDAAPRR